MKKVLPLTLTVFVGGLLYTVYAQGQGSGSTGQPGMTHREQMHKEKDMMGGPRDMQKRTEMMRKAGVSEDQIRQWKTLSKAPIYLDSPEALLGQSDTLGLTADQKQKLQDIQRNARQQAQGILTADQKSKLGTIPDHPVTMMEIHKAVVAKMGAMRKHTLREGGMGPDTGCPMCPMCPMNKERQPDRMDSGTQTTQPSDQQ